MLSIIKLYAIHKKKKKKNKKQPIFIFRDSR
jgi:hypothetical protein